MAKKKTTKKKKVAKKPRVSKKPLENTSDIDNIRDPETGRFLPGNNASPGRPKGTRNRINMKELLDAIADVEAEQHNPKRKNLLRFLVHRAYESDDVLKALFKKLLPDLKAIESISQVDPEEELEQAVEVQKHLRERFELIERVRAGGDN